MLWQFQLQRAQNIAPYVYSPFSTATCFWSLIGCNGLQKVLGHRIDLEALLIQCTEVDWSATWIRNNWIKGQKVLQWQIFELFVCQCLAWGVDQVRTSKASSMEGNHRPTRQVSPNTPYSSISKEASSKEASSKEAWLCGPKTVNLLLSPIRIRRMSFSRPNICQLMPQQRWKMHPHWIDDLKSMFWLDNLTCKVVHDDCDVRAVVIQSPVERSGTGALTKKVLLDLDLHGKIKQE